MLFRRPDGAFHRVVVVGVCAWHSDNAEQRLDLHLVALESFLVLLGM